MAKNDIFSKSPVKLLEDKRNADTFKAAPVAHGGRTSKFVEARKTAKSYQNGMALFRKILEDPDYKRNFVKRAIHGLLPPAVEIMMFHYILGKPTEQININFQEGQEDYSSLTREQLAARIAKLNDRVKAS